MPLFPMRGVLEECLYLVLLDLEGPNSLAQLKFCSEEGGWAPLLTETLLFLAELLLVLGSLFPVLRTLQLGRWFALSVGNSRVREPGGRVGDLWSATGLDPGLVPPAALVASFLHLIPAQPRGVWVKGRKGGRT